MIPQLAALQPGNVSPARSHHPPGNAGSSFAESLVAAGRDLAQGGDQAIAKDPVTDSNDPGATGQSFQPLPADPALLSQEPLTALAPGQLALTSPLSSQPDAEQVADQEATNEQSPLAAESEVTPESLLDSGGQGRPVPDTTAATGSTEAVTHAQVATAGSADLAFTNLTSGSAATGQPQRVGHQPHGTGPQPGADQVGNQAANPGQPAGPQNLGRPETLTGPVSQGAPAPTVQPGTSQETVALPAMSPGGEIRHAAPATPVHQASPVPPTLVEQVRGPLGQLRTAPEGNHVFSIRITPENLGPVQVRAHIGPDSIRVELIGATDAVRDQLRIMLTDLRRDLQSTGMTAQMSVSDSDSAAPDRTAGHGFKDQSGRNHQPSAPAPSGHSGTATHTAALASTAQLTNRAASGVDILA